LAEQNGRTVQQEIRAALREHVEIAVYAARRFLLIAHDFEQKRPQRVVNRLRHRTQVA